MSSGPAVSVIMPAFNAANFIALAVQDVLASTYSDLELIVIDDGSDDVTAGIVESINDPRIRLIRNERNIGLTASLNKGLDAAKGQFIARMDADDRMHPSRFAKQIAALEADPGLALIACCVEQINADGEVTGAWSTDRACVSEASIRRMMPRTNCIAHSSVIMQRDALGKMRYDGPNEDWDLWLRMLASGLRMAKLLEPLVQLRITPGSFMGALSKRMPLEQRLLRARAFFLRRELLRARFNRLHADVLLAQVRTAGGWFLRGCRAFARDAYRCLTYPPFALAREQRHLREALRKWDGDILLLFPYMGIGGAERVHAAIGAAIKDRSPLTVVFGKKQDHGFEQLFRANGPLVEIPRLLHHPFTRRNAHRQLAEALNRAQRPVVLASLSAVFFDLMPLLKPEVRMLYLQHAFLHQPHGNAKWRAWLPWVPRINALLFVSRQAMHEFERFLFANNVSAKDRSRSRFMPNAVERFSPPKAHDRLGLLFVGRDSEEKRLPLFIQICERLHSQRPGAFRFTVAGPAPRATSCPINFLGPISDAEHLGRVYEEHDVLLVTSSREGFPMAIMEAMAHGLAILSTPVGDVPNRVDASHAVLSGTIEAEDVVETFTRAAIELADSKGRLMSMRETAHRKAVSEFSPLVFAQRYQELFREMSGAA